MLKITCLFTSESRLVTTLKVKSFENIVRKGLLPAFSRFYARFSAISKNLKSFVPLSNLLSADTFNLKESGILVWSKVKEIKKNFISITICCLFLFLTYNGVEGCIGTLIFCDM